MILKFNPSGTHIHKDKLKVRLDFYPDATDKAYEYHYVDHYDREPTQEEWDNPELLKLISTHKELNPCLCLFVQIDENTTLQDLQNHISEKYDGSFLKMLDDNIILTSSAHRISVLSKGKTALSDKKVTTANKETLIASKNTELESLIIDKKADGDSKIIEPQSIDIGPGADSAPSTYYSSGNTYCHKTNPANADGTIDTFEIFAKSTLSGSKMGTVYEYSSPDYKCRDVETLGSVTSGSKQTFSGLDCDVVTDDLIAEYHSSGYLGYNGTGDSNSQSSDSGDELTADNTWEPTWWYDKALCLYGTGTEGGGEVEKLSAESGAGTETKADFPGGEITGGESGNGIDTESELEGETGTGDTAAGIESSTLDTGGIVERYAGETGFGSEVVGEREIPASESGTGIETAEKSAGKTASDSGAGNEESVIIPVFFGDDSGTGLDLSILFKDAFDNDAGDSEDRLKALVGLAGIGADRRLPGSSGKVQIPSEKAGIPSKGVNK